MNVGHLLLEILKIPLQFLQFGCRLIMSGGGLVDHLNDSLDELYSDTDEADHGSGCVEHVHSGPEGSAELSEFKGQDNANAYRPGLGVGVLGVGVSAN